MLLATAGTLAANIISKDIAANTIMVTKTTHNPTTGRRDPFGANGVCSWKVFVERFTACRLTERFVGLFANSIPASCTLPASLTLPASRTLPNRQLSAQLPALCRVTRGKQHDAHRISSNITAKAVDSGICGTDNQFLMGRSGSRLPRVARDFLDGSKVPDP